MIGDETVYVRSPGVAFVEGAERTVLLDVARGAELPVVLAGPAAEIWTLVDGARTAADIAEELAGSREVAAPEIQDDVSGFLRQLMGAGYLEQRPGDGGAGTGRT